MKLIFVLLSQLMWEFALALALLLAPCSLARQLQIISYSRLQLVLFLFSRQETQTQTETETGQLILRCDKYVEGIRNQGVYTSRRIHLAQWAGETHKVSYQKAFVPDVWSCVYVSVRCHMSQKHTNEQQFLKRKAKKYICANALRQFKLLQDSDLVSVCDKQRPWQGNRFSPIITATASPLSQYDDDVSNGWSTKEPMDLTNNSSTLALNLFFHLLSGQGGQVLCESLSKFLELPGEPFSVMTTTITQLL